jgi:hypothetical protein
MDPEEPTMPLVGMTLAHRLSCVLVEELADHRLCNGKDDSRVG